jgi:2-C-methyl-D-erythritol 4-phosphate cytidylyltransferase
MGSTDTPKQYVQLGDRTILEHAIEALLGDARIVRVYVVVAPGDTRWPALRIDGARVAFLPVGGRSRAESVRNGLEDIAGTVADDDRVLVHDAARPCLDAPQLAQLIDVAGADEDGGLLAVALNDTLKRADDHRSVATLDRGALWCAQTPQLFRFGALRAALAAGPLDGITDEASAMERTGHAPRLVAGVPTNLKITTPADLVLARAVLHAQGRLHDGDAKR